VPTHVVSQLDIVRLLKEKGLTDIPQTLEEMGLGKVGAFSFFWETQDTVLNGSGLLHVHTHIALWSTANPLSHLFHPHMQTVVSSVSEDTPALVAFHHMATDHKSAMAVTNSQGKLVGSLSVADLRSLPSDNFSLLLQPIKQLLPTVFKDARLDKVRCCVGKLIAFNGYTIYS
jgi:CBS domain-containing protein